MKVYMEIADDKELRAAVRDLVLGQVRHIVDSELGHLIDRVINERIQALVDEKLETALTTRLNKTIDQALGADGSYGAKDVIKQLTRDIVNKKLQEYFEKNRDVV